jgi:glucose dehydrogenase
MLSASASASNVEWPTYGATYANTRHVDIGTLRAAALPRLHPVWQFALGPHERVETTPIVSGTTMYLTTGVQNNVVALDARTGKLKWRYKPSLGAMSPCCGALNRGVAVGQNLVYVATLDAQLIALNASSGKPVWHVQIADGAHGFSETMAPLFWNGTVIIGSSGSDYGIRGSVSAYRASDGRFLWRWYAVSPGWEGRYTAAVNGFSLHRDIAKEKRALPAHRDAWKHGGGAVWMTPALDVKTGVLYASTGNPSPVYNGSVRPGDNLYTDSIVALDARSGKLLWYYQQTPHDIWEYEAASPPILFDSHGRGGDPTPAVAEAGKTRWLYVLNRKNGKLIRLSQPWSPNADVYQPYARALAAPKERLPLRGTIGPIAYNPALRTAYVTEIDHIDAESWSDLLVAIDVDTGAIRWKKMLGPVHKTYRGDPVLAGALSAGPLVFVSDPDGDFTALDAKTGELLWRYQLGSDRALDNRANAFERFVHVVHDWLLPLKRALFRQEPPTQAAAGVDTSPIAFEIDGKPYVTIGFDLHPERASGGAVVTTFSL